MQFSIINMIKKIMEDTWQSIMKTGTWANHNDICKFPQVLIINTERRVHAEFLYPAEFWTCFWTHYNNSDQSIAEHKTK